MADLNPRKERFAALVAQGKSQAAAYREAFPGSKKWKDKTVWARASELAADSKVLGRVEELQRKAATAHEVTQERIVKELARIAFCNQRSLMTWGPRGVSLLDSDELSEDVAAAVSEAQETVTKDGGSIRLKTYDKIKALELLGKHVGMFTDKMQLTGADGGPLSQHMTVRFVRPGDDG